MNQVARVAAALALCAACAGAPKSPALQPKVDRPSKPDREGAAVPAWVDQVPENSKGKLVAVGYSQPSFWPQDAIDAAAADARSQLALALGSHVEVLGIDTATATATGGATISKEATDVGMENSRIEGAGVGAGGEGGEPGGGVGVAPPAPR